MGSALRWALHWRPDRLRPAAPSSIASWAAEAAPLELITACGLIIDNTALSRADRAAALVVRADARARTSDGMSKALADLDRAIALDDKNAAAFRLRGD